MHRLTNFYNLRGHPFYSKLFLKLTASDIDLCVQFIKTTRDCSNNEFEHKINRMFLNSKEKPKSFSLIQEMLSVSK